MQYVFEQLNKQVSTCHAEIDHFQSMLDMRTYPAALREKCSEQVSLWKHRKEQCENALLILEMSGCKKDHAPLS